MGCWGAEASVYMLAVRVFVPPSQATSECSGEEGCWHHMAHTVPFSHAQWPPRFQSQGSLEGRLPLQLLWKAQLTPSKPPCPRTPLEGPQSGSRQ